MNDSRAAIRYAKATLNYAVEKKEAEKVETDMRKIAYTISDNEELQDLLESPVVKSDIKKNSLNNIFKDVNEISKGLIRTLVENKRINLLHDVAEKYVFLHEKLKGEDVAHVTTAVPLSDDLEAKIAKKVAGITGKKLKMKNKVDQSIVGGFVLRVGDMQYDASVASKLRRLKREFTNSL